MWWKKRRLIQLKAIDKQTFYNELPLKHLLEIMYEKNNLSAPIATITKLFSDMNNQC